MTSTYLVTGGMGCIGAWTLHHLVRQNKRAICFDLSKDRRRLDLLLSRDEQDLISFVGGDLTDTALVRNVFATYGVSHVVHLGALQVPFCRANPAAGAQVNVTGTVNIFEAARHSGVNRVAYASSVAVYGPPELYPPGPLAASASVAPRTLYGVYKVANEQTAQIYWQDCGLSSIALRPYTVYGLGRDQGLTSEPTQAMLAAACGQDFHIRFGGQMNFHFASDVAQQFIAAAESTAAGAHAFNLGGPIVAMAEVASLIMACCPAVSITYADELLPFPSGCDDTELRRHAPVVYATPLEEGIRATIDAFTLLAAT